MRHSDGCVVEFPRKAYAVIVYLALDQSGQVARRDDIAKFLWPQSDLRQQQDRLRTLLKRVRTRQEARDLALFEIDHQTVALKSNAVVSDLSEFNRLLSTGAAIDVLAAGELIKGELLDGCDRGPASFEHWVRTHRSRVVDVFIAEARRVMDTDFLSQHPDKSEALALRVIDLSPCEEEGYHALMRLSGSRGDFDNVKKIYDRLVRTIKLEMGCRPTDKTRALFRSLVALEMASLITSDSSKNDQSAVQEAGPTSARSRKIADGPILQIPSSPASNSSLADSRHRALVDEFVVQLWRPRAIKIVVVDDHAAFSAAAQTVAQANIYQMHLGVADVRSARLSARLSHALSGEMLWAESFQFSPEMHEPLMSRIANSVLGKLEDHQIEMAGNLKEGDLPAFTLVAQGNRALLQADLPSVRRARRLFRAASDTSENNLGAETGIARTFRLEWILRAGQDPTLLSSARTIARTTLEAQPDSYLAHRELGMTALYQRQYDLATEHLHRARELHPHDPEMLFDFADVLICDGAAQEALELIETVKGFDYKLADFRNWIAASGRYALGQYAAAIVELEQMRNPESTYRLRAASHAMLGQAEEAKEFMKKSLDDNPGFSVKTWLSMCPVRMKADIEHFDQGYRSAGFK